MAPITSSTSKSPALTYQIATNVPEQAVIPPPDAPQWLLTEKGQANIEQFLTKERRLGSVWWSFDSVLQNFGEYFSRCFKNTQAKLASGVCYLAGKENWKAILEKRFNCSLDKITSDEMWSFCTQPPACFEIHFWIADASTTSEHFPRFLDLCTYFMATDRLPEKLPYGPAMLEFGYLMDPGSGEKNERAQQIEKNMREIRARTLRSPDSTNSFSSSMVLRLTPEIHLRITFSNQPRPQTDTELELFPRNRMLSCHSPSLLSDFYNRLLKMEPIRLFCSEEQTIKCADSFDTLMKLGPDLKEAFLPIALGKLRGFCHPEKGRFNSVQSIQVLALYFKRSPFNIQTLPYLQPLIGYLATHLNALLDKKEFGHLFSCAPPLILFLARAPKEADCEQAAALLLPENLWDHFKKSELSDWSSIQQFQQMVKDKGKWDDFVEMAKIFDKALTSPLNTRPGFAAYFEWLAEGLSNKKEYDLLFTLLEKIPLIKGDKVIHKWFQTCLQHYIDAKSLTSVHVETFRKAGGYFFAPSEFLVTLLQYLTTHSMTKEISFLEKHLKKSSKESHPQKSQLEKTTALPEALAAESVQTEPVRPTPPSLPESAQSVRQIEPVSPTLSAASVEVVPVQQMEPAVGPAPSSLLEAPVTAEFVQQMEPVSTTAPVTVEVAPPSLPEVPTPSELKSLLSKKTLSKERIDRILSLLKTNEDWEEFFALLKPDHPAALPSLAWSLWLRTHPPKKAKPEEGKLWAAAITQCLSFIRDSGHFEIFLKKYLAHLLEQLESAECKKIYSWCLDKGINSWWKTQDYSSHLRTLFYIAKQHLIEKLGNPFELLEGETAVKYSLLLASENDPALSYVGQIFFINMTQVSEIELTPYSEKPFVPEDLELQSKLYQWITKSLAASTIDDWDPAGALLQALCRFNCSLEGEVSLADDIFSKWEGIITRISQKPSAPPLKADNSLETFIQYEKSQMPSQTFMAATRAALDKRLDQTLSPDQRLAMLVSVAWGLDNFERLFFSENLNGISILKKDRLVTIWPRFVSAAFHDIPLENSQGVIRTALLRMNYLNRYFLRWNEDCDIAVITFFDSLRTILEISVEDRVLTYLIMTTIESLMDCRHVVRPSSSGRCWDTFLFDLIEAACRIKRKSIFKAVAHLFSHCTDLHYVENKTALSPKENEVVVFGSSLVLSSYLTYIYLECLEPQEWIDLFAGLSVESIMSMIEHLRDPPTPPNLLAWVRIIRHCRHTNAPFLLQLNRWLRIISLHITPINDPNNLSHVLFRVRLIEATMSLAQKFGGQNEHIVQELHRSALRYLNTLQADLPLSETLSFQNGDFEIDIAGEVLQLYSSLLLEPSFPGKLTIAPLFIQWTLQWMKDDRTYQKYSPSVVRALKSERPVVEIIKRLFLVPDESPIAEKLRRLKLIIER